MRRRHEESNLCWSEEDTDQDEVEDLNENMANRDDEDCVMTEDRDVRGGIGVGRPKRRRSSICAMKSWYRMGQANMEQFRLWIFA